IHDFLHAEPRFASSAATADDELRALVDAAHAEGLYVILDIVLNHVGDVFAYDCDAGDGLCRDNAGAQASFHSSIQPIAWRDASGTPRPDWTSLSAVTGAPADALVWPRELQKDQFFRRQGAMPSPEDDTVGDFASLKQMMTTERDLQNYLIRAYQYVI